MTKPVQSFEHVPGPLAAYPSSIGTRTLDTNSPPRPPRLFYLDHLRILLSALVVLHHLAITYGSLPTLYASFYYIERPTDPSGRVLDHLTRFNQAFFMGFFFLIAGYFVPGSYDRKGGRAFLRDQLVRLGIPLVVFVFVLNPILCSGVYPIIRARAAERGFDQLPYWLLYVITCQPGPLWFVEVLLVFNWVYVLFRKTFSRRSVAPAPCSAPIEGRWPALGAVLAYALLLAAATYLWRFIVPVGQSWLLPVIGCPTPAWLPQYASLYVIGIQSYRRGWMHALPRSAGAFGVAQAAIASALLYPVAMGYGTYHWMAYALWESLFAVGMILSLLVLFRERFNGDWRLGRFLSGQTYAVYIIHPLVLVALGYAFAGLKAVAVVKFVVVAAIAVPLCWASAYLIRSLPWVRRVL